MGPTALGTGAAPLTYGQARHACCSRCAHPSPTLQLEAHVISRCARTRARGVGRPEVRDKQSGRSFACLRACGPARRHTSSASSGAAACRLPRFYLGCTTHLCDISLLAPGSGVVRGGRRTRVMHGLRFYISVSRQRKHIYELLRPSASG